MADTTLVAIQNKVRKLTRNMTENALSTSDINQYINTFVLYDFPEHLKLFNLRQTFSFYCEAFIDEYDPATYSAPNPLYDFNNKYFVVEPPIYVAGYQTAFMESRQQFFGVYPKLVSVASIGIDGDGSTTTFSGFINTQQANTPPNLMQNLCLLRNNILFDSIDSSGNSMSLIDYPLSVTTGALGIPGVPEVSLPSPYGSINYLTGAFTVIFPNPPAAGQFINSQSVLMQPARPQTMLFFDGKFTLRPVPDQAYKVNIEVYAQPTELLSNSQSPDLKEWWQVIAYGAAIKVFQDRMDLESVQQIMPEFNMQRLLVQRRTIVQQTSQRASTIYAQDNNAAGIYGAGWFSGAGGNSN